MVFSFWLLLWTQAAAPADAARAAIDELGARIRALLSAELAQGGFVGAVNACATKAQPATRDYAREKGIAIRRVSLRARNPADAPDAFERRVLQTWEKDGPREYSETVTLAGGARAFRLMRPIVIQPMCLACHGDPAPGVRAAIRKHYPNDPATGYKNGDLRGAFSVQLSLDPSGR